LGKLYSSELQQLSETYSWAMSASVEALTRVVEASLSSPLISTGSGGSLTVAHLASWLHQKYAGKIAKALTPFDLVSSSAILRDATVLMLTARGGNPDIIGGFKRVVSLEPKRLVIACSRTKSRLSRLAQSYRYVDVVEFDLPTGKDGFLATNSLLAFAVMLSRAWSDALSIELDLPEAMESFYPNSSAKEFFDDLAIRCVPVWEKETVNILYGPSVHTTAVDLESKFTEAALGMVQLADYRNFAHGRHHWLAKRGNTSGVIAFITDDDRQIANKTLNLIPSHIPIVRVEIPFAGLRANIAGIVSALHLTAFVGKARGIDPGRPGVPEFGSKIYRLSGLGVAKRTTSAQQAAEAAIERKAGTTVEILSRRGEFEFWRNAHDTFLEKLKSQVFAGIVFDFDGTLCDGRDRYKGVDAAVVQHLIRLLRSGVIIGVATGRGKSVREGLRSKIPQALWSRVAIGYYNGSDNGLLDSDLHPDSTDCLCNELVTVYDMLNSDPTLIRLANYLSERTRRRSQITMQMRQSAPVGLIQRAVQQVVHKLNTPGVEVVYSSHSVDVIAPGVTKKKLVEEVGKLAGNSSGSVLCIGDLGQWPGNDFALLSADYSLSVDAVSSDPATCWNIAPPGHRGVQAVLDYLACLHFSKGALRFATAHHRKNRV
jgi:hypothetical protein